MKDIVFVFLLTALVFLLLVINHKGFIYDVLKEKDDANYKDNHSINWTRRKLRFSLPSYITENSKKPELISASKNYNKYSAIFWIGTILSIILYFILS